MKITIFICSMIGISLGIFLSCKQVKEDPFPSVPIDAPSVQTGSPTACSMLDSSPACKKEQPIVQTQVKPLESTQTFIPFANILMPKIEPRVIPELLVNPQESVAPPPVIVQEEPIEPEPSPSYQQNEGMRTEETETSQKEEKMKPSVTLSPAPEEASPSESIEVKGSQETTVAKVEEKGTDKTPSPRTGIPLTLDASLDERTKMVSEWCVPFLSFTGSHYKNEYRITESTYLKTEGARLCSFFEDEAYKEKTHYFVKFDVSVHDGLLYASIKYWLHGRLVTRIIPENGSYPRSVEPQDKLWHGFHLDLEEKIPVMPSMFAFMVIYNKNNSTRTLLVSSTKEPALIASNYGAYRLVWNFFLFL